MISKKTMIAVSIIPLALALAGCKHNDDTAQGPGGPGTPGGPVAGDFIATKTTDTASNALKDGKTLKAASTNSATVELAYGANSAKLADPASFTIKKNAKGGVDMMVNGETVSFATADKFIEADGKSFGWEKEDGNDYSGLFTFSSEEAADAIDGSDKNYLQVWQYQTDRNGIGTRGFAVVGAETAPEIVKAQANATYKGRARVDTHQETNRKDRVGVRGDLTLAAKFDQGSVSGSIDNIQARERTDATWSNWQAVNGAAVTLTESKIGANAFTGGKVVGNAAINTAIDGNLNGSTYSGRFYGPQADQVGGVISAKGVSEGGKFVGAGYFMGEKQ